MLIMQSIKFLLVLNTALFVCEGASVKTSSPKRSEIWDAYIKSLEDAHKESSVRREATTETYDWQSDRTNCVENDYTTHDRLTRRVQRSQSDRDSPLLASPQDQQSCGSCWAFATVHTLTDTINLKHPQSRQPLLSATDLVLCNNDEETVEGNGNGCCGAYLCAGPVYIAKEGVRSNECVEASSISKEEAGDSTNCPQQCHANSSPSDRMFQNSLSYQTLTNDMEIIAALDASSTVLAGMEVTVEFLTYKCGVYRKKVESIFCGSHSVEIVDYGPKTGTPQFWVVKNSWGTEVQENGYFRIRMGELNIGGNGNALNLSISEGSTTSSRSLATQTTFSACGETSINNKNNPMLLSAVKMAVSQLMEMEMICCEPVNNMCAESNNYNQETISVRNPKKAVVDGISITFDATIDLLDCATETKVNFSAEVIIGIDLMLSIEFLTMPKTYTVRHNRIQGLVSQWWLVMVSVLLTAIAFQERY